MMRARLVVIASFLTLVLLSGLGHPWGTLSEQLPMTDHERGQLEFLINHYGIGDEEQKNSTRGEIVPRQGPHPTHQLIVRQAYLLLQKDPAYQDSPWPLPRLDSVLAWDGIEREVGRTDGMNGMWERTRPGTDVAVRLAPAKGEVGGPSADAEITRDGRWNPSYDGAKHYWNPWLRSGSAPTAAGTCYATLIDALVYAGNENEKAHAVSHLTHYLADAMCPKHADVVALDGPTLRKLSRYADAWFREHADHSDMGINAWLASAQITQALDCIVQASGAGPNSPYWRRVNAEIVNRALFNPNESSMRPYPDVALPSLRAAVGAFLAVLHERPPEKDLVRFYDFFDPFYYNGQLLMEYGGYSVPATATPNFALATPTGEHLMWETSPALVDYVGAAMKNPDAPLPGLEQPYIPLPAVEGLWKAEDKIRFSAYRKAMAEYVQQASVAWHGKTPDSREARRDFDRGSFREAFPLTVKYVFSALRACISALRCSATYAYFPEEHMFRVYCDITNVADEAAQIKEIRVSIPKGLKLESYAGWTTTLDSVCSVAKGKRRRVVVEVPQGELTDTTPQFYVEVFGRYEKTPDLGYVRSEVSMRPGRIMQGMSLPAFDRVTGPLDLAICFDVTGSMSSSINSVRNNAIDILTKLKQRLGDLRVALISFRDIKADKDVFTVTPFSSDIKGVIATMKSWQARGGGDEEEDQLAAIRKALDMWDKIKSDPRKPTKIVVVITDAPPHDPDVKGNTQQSIADYAERVDPAHIYPIIVGSNASAHAKAADLAKLTGGEVLTAKSGDEVAAVLMATVQKAIAAHSGESQKRLPPGALFYGGLGVIVIGAWLWRRDRKLRKCSAPNLKS
jgi:Mg-chelatase subunit ChlD